jgi:hypothetical protein
MYSPTFYQPTPTLSPAEPGERGQETGNARSIILNRVARGGDAWAVKVFERRLKIIISSRRMVRGKLLK